MITSKIYFNFLVLMLMLIVFLPVIGNNLPPIIGSFHFYYFLFLFSLFLYNLGTILNKSFIITLIISAIIFLVLPQLLWINMDDWNRNAQLKEGYAIISSLTVFYYYFTTKDFYGYAKIIKITFIFIVITSLLSIYTSILEPRYARLLAGGWDDEEQMRYYLRLGGGTYAYANALLGIFPILIYYFKNNFNFFLSKRNTLIIIILFFFTLIRMQIFGNIIIAFLIILLSFQGSRRVRKVIIIYLLLSFVFILIPKEIYSSLLRLVSNFFNESSDVYFKLNDMAIFLESGNVDTATAFRAARYPDLVSSFLRAPIFGVASNDLVPYNQAGAHLYWMNRLAIWGIIGFTLFIYLIKQNISIFLNQIQNVEFKLYYIISIFSVLGYGLIKNITGREVWFMLFFIIPGTYYLPLMKNRKILNIKIK